MRNVVTVATVRTRTSLKLQPVRPPPSVGHPPREVVDQLHLAAADDVVDVAVEQALGMQGVLERNQ